MVTSQKRDNINVNIPQELMNLVSQALDSPRDGSALALAVRQTLDAFATQHPGRSVEVRVPPYRVVQVIGGSTHKRGTPPAVVEMAPLVWLELVSGNSDWQSLLEEGQIFASGVGSDLSEFFGAQASQS